MADSRLGILLQLIGRLVARDEANSLLGSILTLVGFALFIWGCINYAAGKGHSKWIGLVGILSCLVLLPDHHK